MVCFAFSDTVMVTASGYTCEEASRSIYAAGGGASVAVGDEASA